MDHTKHSLSTPAAISKPALGLLAALLLLSLLLQGWAAVRQSFWEDEAYSAVVAERPAEERAQAIAQDVHPPLYLNTAAVWGRLFGFNEAGLRSLSLPAAALAVLLSFAIARRLALAGAPTSTPTRLLPGEAAGLWAAALLALHPAWLMFAPMARYYAWAAALSLLAVWWMLRASTPPDPEQRRGGLVLDLLGYILTGVALLYLLYTSALVLAVCAAWGLWRLLHARPRAWSRTAGWLAAQLIIVALFIAGPNGLLSVGTRFAETSLPPAVGIEIIKRLGYSLYVFAVGETLSPLNPLAWLGLLLVSGLAIFAAWAQRRHAAGWLPVAVIAVCLAGSIALTLNAAVAVTWQSLPTRTFFVLPFIAIWLGLGLAHLPPRSAAAAGVLLLLVFGAAGWNFFSGQQYLRPLFAVPWQGIMDGIQAQAEPGAVVRCSGDGDYACSYYVRRWGFSSPDLPTPADAPPEVWLIEVNIGRQTSAMPQNLLTWLQANYAAPVSTPYARQDDGIRQLKNRFTGQDDYEYRVIVWHYTRP